MDKKENKITVVGSGNCDIFICTDRMPGKGETLSAKSLMRAPGGKVITKLNSRVQIKQQLLETKVLK